MTNIEVPGTCNTVVGPDYRTYKEMTKREKDIIDIIREVWK